MKYTKTTLKELTKRYAAVLKKCAFLNAIILGAVAVASSANAAVIKATTGNLTLDEATYNNESIVTENGYTVTLIDPNINITEDEKYVLRANGEGSKIIIGEDKTGTIDITAKASGGAAVLAREQGQVLILADKVNIDTASSFGVLAQNSTQGVSPGATLKITANEININGGVSALGAYSDGELYIEGNTTISGGTFALITRGGATTEINKSGKHTVDMTGDVTFQYMKSASNTPVDATVDITLAGDKSVWNGNTRVQYQVTPPSTDYLDVTGFTLNIIDGATWNAGIVNSSDTQRYQAMNNLNIATGTVNIEDTTNGITVEKLVADNATFNATGKGGNLTITDTATITNSTFQNGTGANGGAINNLGTTSISGTFTGNTATTWGGAIYNNGVLTVTDSSFEGNTAGHGGAIFNNNGTVTINGATKTVEFRGNTGKNAAGAFYNSKLGKATINNALFIDNNAAMGGAINNAGSMDTGTKEQGLLELSNVAFVNNSGGKSQGGAIRNQGQVVNLINANSTLRETYGGDFVGNTAGNGGAINNGQIGEITIDTASFVNNEATVAGGLGQGGAITNAYKLTFTDSASFTGNKASKIGGALFNGAAIERATTTFADVTFENNSADEQGGAIYNEAVGDVIFNGTATFTGNTAGGKANDIHNAGTLTFNGDAKFTGGITGDGVIAFNGTTLDIGSSVIQGSEIAIKDGTTLKADLMSGTAGFDAAKLSGNDINLVFDAGSENGTLTFAQGNADALTFANNNALFDIVTGTDTVTVVKKATSEITEELTANTGMDETTAMGVVTMTEAEPTTPQAQAIADEIVRLAQSTNPTDQAKAGELAKAVQPTRAAVAQAIHTNTRVINAASGRMNARMGHNGGDLADAKVSPWVKGLFNKTHNSQGDGFDAYSHGFAFGVDAKISDSLLVGAGYAKTNSTVKEDNRRTHVNGDNYFVYGKYQPAKWYVETVLNYGHAKNKSEAVGLTGRYDVDTYSAQVLSGYQYGIADNYAGLRYTYVKADDYNNGLNNVEGKNTQVATAVIGTRISKEFDLNETVSYTPEFRLAGTYDIKSDNAKTNVNVIGGNTTYSVDGERLHRAALEAGVGLTGTIGNVEVSAGYDVEWRVSNFSQTGMLKLKYNF